MSNKKPNLTIQIEELGDQFNSKFQGYVQYSIQNAQEIKKYGTNQDIHGSRASHRSNQSNVSNRSALLQRAQQLFLQERLSHNMKSLSKNKFKALSNSRNRLAAQGRESVGSYKSKNQSLIQNNMVIRSKSVNSLSAQNSRAKVLQQIVDKLKKIEKLKNNQSVNQQKLQISQALSRIHSEQNDQGHPRIEKIKQIKQQMIKNRGGKLQHLLKDIKKSNKQAYKVVYTIKKSSKNASPFQKSLQMRDRINQQSKKTVTNANLLYNSSEKSDNLRKLAEEIQNVRMELKQVKNKNQELLQISQYRSTHTSYMGHNLDSGSQSSRMTQKMQAIQLESLSNNSVYVPRNSSRNSSTFVVHPSSFTKLDNNIGYYNANNPHIQYIVHQTPIIQPCFACGCTCKSKINIVK